MLLRKQGKLSQHISGTGEESQEETERINLGRVHAIFLLRCSDQHEWLGRKTVMNHRRSRDEGWRD